MSSRAHAPFPRPSRPPVRVPVPLPVPLPARVPAPSPSRPPLPEHMPALALPPPTHKRRRGDSPIAPTHLLPSTHKELDDAAYSDLSVEALAAAAFFFRVFAALIAVAER